MMAAGDVFFIKLTGTGGHGAAPHEATDLVAMAGTVIQALTGITRRKIDASSPAILSIGRIEGGKSPNVIPAELLLEGTTRYIDPQLGEIFPQLIDQVLQGVTEAYGGHYHFDYCYGYPVLKNDSKIVDLVRQSATEIAGKNNILPLSKPSLTSEDFAVYLERVPGCYFWVGTRNPEKGLIHSLHQPTFDLDEDVFPLAVAILANAVLKALANRMEGRRCFEVNCNSAG
ncbi:MAG: M20/M25/M40 family metallo-hydrolase, partial [Bacillota bacterium]